MALTEAQPGSSEAEREPLPPEKAVIKDFYLSYRFSQGEGGGQHWLFHRLADYYRSAWSDEDKARVLANLEAIFDDAWEDFGPPRNHRKRSNNGVDLFGEQQKEQQTEVADYFIEVIKSRLGSETVPETDTSTPFDANSLKKVGTDMIQRDLYYAGPVNSRSIGSDPHASYFREYILLHRPTGSEAFDTIFQAVTDAIPPDGFTIFNGRETFDGAARLQQAWEKMHQGQSFYPEAETAA